ncbi:hypothetical protein C7964_102969 [Loktanella sp. PT4BL]|uniref:hypothetical protein n=1 Tax=Loktanella sp. PT4BL TaxID=2135611 RepID=UPI000D764F88|nr:hypothetical protein [Loktanella sp. PT4BL]PXW71067.1 hypothetical protein C7964_102969 [Loktanella sp. PT4BL]
MSPRQTRTLAPWKKLLTSGNIFGDLCDIYDADFFDEFASHFDRNPKVFDLFKGVHETGQAYVMGKWAQKATNSNLLKFSGVHLIGAGLSARRLSYELSQVNKSAKVSKAVQSEVQKALAASDTRPFGKRTYLSIQFHNGPKSQLTAIHELASALEEAIGTIIPLPYEDEEEKDVRRQAFEFVNQANNAPKKPLHRNHAMLEAARAFRPLWEECSTLPYRRGRYKHEIGGYDCKPADALFAIIAKLDPTVAQSLPGTAIENIHAQLQAEMRSD